MSTAGDGTVVPRLLAAGAATTWYAPAVSHGDLVKEPRILQAVGGHPGAGDDRSAPRSPSGIGRGGVPATGGRWMSPAEAGA